MKHLLTLALFVCLGTFASAQIPSYVPTNGLVGWWPFNGNANDESGNGNHGTVNGATLAADRFGNAGKAYSFDGVDDYIGTNFPGIIAQNSRTISFWFNSNNNTIGVKTMVGYGEHTSSVPQGSRFDCTMENGKPSIDIGYTFASYAINNVQNNWKLYTVAYESSFGINVQAIKLYIDGTLQQNPLILNTSISINTGNLYKVFFGAPYANPSGNSFNGLIDDIAIYNRALTAAEVQQLYLANCTQPTFTAQPQNKSVAQGQTTTFAVQVDTTSTFQWQMNLGLGAGWANIPQSSLFSGDTTSTLSVQGRSTIDGAQFRCIATACQSDTSIAATLTVTSNPSTLGSVAGVPGKINYQGAAVDSAGKPMKNQTIALKLSVLDSSSSGAAAYVETHSTPTNGSGIFSLQIGGGTAVTGTFDSIPWANGRNKYLKTEVQQNGTWINLGTSQLVSVPYALVSGVAKEAQFAQNSGSANSLRDSLGNVYAVGVSNNKPELFYKNQISNSTSLSNQILLTDTFQVIPSGISMVHIEIRGGNGGAGSSVPFCPYIQGELGGCPGGLGASAELFLFVNKNDTISFIVGKNGSIGQPGSASMIFKNGVNVFSAGGGGQGSNACCGGAAYQCGYSGWTGCGPPPNAGTNGTCSATNFQSKIAVLKTGNIGGGIIFVNYYQ